MAKNNNLKVWLYFTWFLAVVTGFIAFTTKPDYTRLNRTKSQIVTTNREISKAKKEPVFEKDNTETFDVVSAKNEAIKKVSTGLSQAVGGYSNSEEYQSHSRDLNYLFGKDLTLELYRLNGSPDEAYTAKASSKLKFTIAKAATVNVGFTDISDPKHTNLLGIICYKPNYLDYGLIKIVNLDYDLEKQQTNNGKISNIKNPQLKGFYSKN